MMNMNEKLVNLIEAIDLVYHEVPRFESVVDVKCDSIFAVCPIIIGW